MKENRFLLKLRISITLLIFSLFFLNFLFSHSNKGTFHADEPGIAINSYASVQFMRTIQSAAYQAQPPLYYLVQSYFYIPIVTFFGLQKVALEFFFRLLSLFVWLGPILYFAFNWAKYSAKNRIIILTTFLILAGSEFLGFYLAEVRHYSAIAAASYLSLLLLLREKEDYFSIRYVFLIVSLILPHLHIISFPYFLCFSVYFNFTLFNIFYPKHKKELLLYWSLTVVSIFATLVLYSYIRHEADTWVHTSNQILSLYSPTNEYILKTLDWMFSGWPFYLPFRFIVDIPFVRHWLLVILLGSGTAVFVRQIKNIKSKNAELFSVLSFSCILFALIWPASCWLALSRTGMFQGERYSIAMLPILVYIFLSVSWMALSAIRPLQQKWRAWIMVILVLLLSAASLFSESRTIIIKTEAQKLFEDHAEIFADKSAKILLDTGSYSSAFNIVASILNKPINAEIKYCPRHLSPDVIMNWLASDADKTSTYYLGPMKHILRTQDIRWQAGSRLILARLTSVHKEDICTNSDVGPCLLACFPGNDLDRSGRKIVDSVPYLAQ